MVKIYLKIKDRLFITDTECNKRVINHIRGRAIVFCDVILCVVINFYGITKYNFVKFIILFDCIGFHQGLFCITAAIYTIRIIV